MVLSPADISHGNSFSHIELKCHPKGLPINSSCLHFHLSSCHGGCGNQSPCSSMNSVMSNVFPARIPADRTGCFWGIIINSMGSSMILNLLSVELPHLPLPAQFPHLETMASREKFEKRGSRWTKWGIEKGYLWLRKNPGSLTNSILEFSCILYHTGRRVRVCSMSKVQNLPDFNALQGSHFGKHAYCWSVYT